MSNFVPEKTALGIEFGSTRIKAVLIGPEHTPLHRGIIPGKTSCTTASGPTHWNRSGRACKVLTLPLPLMYSKNTAAP